MLAASRAKQYGIELEVSDETYMNTVSIESIISGIEASCGDFKVSLEETFDGEFEKVDPNDKGEVRGKIDHVGVIEKIITTIREFFKKMVDAVINFFKRSTAYDAHVEKVVNGVQDKIKQLKALPHLKAVGTEDANGQGITIDIGSLTTVDLHNKLSNDITSLEFNELVKTFIRSGGSLNGYFQHIDNHLNDLPNIQEDVINKDSVSDIYGKFANTPKIPADMRVQEHDFFTIGKIGVPAAFEKSGSEDLKSLSGDINKNAPRVIKNVDTKTASVTIGKSDNIVNLADHWYGDLEKIKHAGKLSGQYLRIALTNLEGKQATYNKLLDKSAALSKSATDQAMSTKIQAYINVLKSHMNYISMYINVMTYYHNAYNKITTAMSKALDKVLDSYMAFATA